MNILQIGLIGIVGALLAVQLKAQKPEYSIYVGVATSVILFFYITGKLSSVIETVYTIQSYIHLETSYMQILLKIIGITYIAELSSNICKDAGHQAIGNQIESFGKIAILAVSMPILIALIDTINNLLQ
ncbi:stage III sporulation protein AD [Anaerosacchariphilus polymeriproducens]|uniref:Stage III sporulation protein AD n=1 Tax=Anaerosacchariphilus polymeriproducens TaxID=1812858 RepID=A0A371AXW9_9FIRM|nr:stage III sporulation protein AD [Anaerosacchariphilus polymeriproducens]RDU24352.1 stage III sporulation protein AD [Anaerosacchariphilus polymeriproducens]